MSAGGNAVNQAEAAPDQQAAGDVWQMQISTPVDSTLARDYVTVTPHFHDLSASGVDPNVVSDAVGAGMLAWLKANYEVRIRMYKATGNPPHYPVHDETYGTVGNTITSQAPREVALCLSYYASFNRPRFRGRLYIPHAWIYRAMTTPAPPGSRPGAGERTAVGNFATQVLQPGATAGVRWILWSKTSQTSNVVSNWYVDDEWDTVRSRGTRPTTRTTGTVPQAGLQLVALLYSERFVSGTGNEVVTNWACPAGKRAVVRSVGYGVGTAAGALFYVTIAGVLFFAHSFTGDYSGGNVDCRQVLYAGETLGVTTIGSSTYVTVSGYLFEDPSGRTSPPGETTVEALARPEVLPAQMARKVAIAVGWLSMPLDGVLLILYVTHSWPFCR